MKFMNPGTGEVFENIRDAIGDFCVGRKMWCCDCPLYAENTEINTHMCSLSFSESSQEEVAKYMGYEVIGGVTDD